MFLESMKQELHLYTITILMSSDTGFRGERSVLLWRRIMRTEQWTFLWLPVQIPSNMRSVLELVGLLSINCDLLG